MTMMDSGADSTGGYVPLQPEMAWHTADYQEYKAYGNAHSIPALFYQFRTKGVGSPDFVAIPDGHVDAPRNQIFRCMDLCYQSIPLF